MSFDPTGLLLWYKQSANEWVEALPVGNGRLGAMVFGRVGEERLQLNEDTLWAGGPYDPNNPNALAALPEVRRMVFAGRYEDAQRMVDAKLMARPLKQMPYQTPGDLHLSFKDIGETGDYRRELDLDSAVARTTFRDASGARHSREVFVSPIDQVIVVRLTADRPGKIAFTARLSSPLPATVSVEGTDTLILRGRNGDAEGIAGALKFTVRARVAADGGKVMHDGDSLTVTGANSATLLIAIATSYRGPADVGGDPDAMVAMVLEKARRRRLENVRRDHVLAHQKLFRRVSIDLGKTPASELPTDERVRDSGKRDDPQLAALYFQYARYLLISSSQPGCQPANLQGIWNESLSPPWGSKYTININTEMNYWPAEPTNLAECAEPLLTLVRELAETGARTARSQYGAGGWVCHHNTDLWRASAPIDGAFWGMWPTGGAWLCLHLWERYDYNPDPKFLAQIYPLLKGAAQFFVETLVVDPNSGHLVTNPSISPENRHPKGSSICAGPSMDNQIIRDLFGRVIDASLLLKTDAPLREQLLSMRGKLAPNSIGASGKLMEWREDWDDAAPEREHRHVSHLYGLFPSHQISPDTTPELAAAVGRSLDARGDKTTGWAIAWRINLWARMRDSDRAHRILKLLLDPSRTYPNLFDAHPPFQIDGNFGGANAIAEMLQQSRPSTASEPPTIHLLPALPAAWPGGAITGLRARGGIEVDVHWASGKLERATLRSLRAGTWTVRHGDQRRKITLRAGQQITLDSALAG